MTLLNVIQELGNLDKECTIYATKPLTENSIAIVAQEPDSGGIPYEAEELDMKYFIEVIIAYEFLKDWEDTLERKPDIHEKCARLIHYVINDA